MILITIILTIIGSTIYTIIGNLIIRWLDKINLIEVDFEHAGEDTTFFALGVIFPVILFYILVKEVSYFIFSKFNER